jgi:hypothetical protein
MARLFAVSTCALCIAFGSADAAAYHVDPKTKAVTLDSLRDFDKCVEGSATHGADLQEVSSEACLDALRTYVKANPKDAFAAGKRVRVHYMHWLALDFFVQALADEPTHKRCANEDVGAAVLSGLALPSRYPAVALATNLVSGPCRRELEPFVTARLKGAGETFRGNVCPLLADKGRDCDPRQAESGATAQPAHPPEPSAAATLAAVPRVRQAPPSRDERPELPPVQRLEEVFPSVPAGQPLGTPPAAAATVADLKGVDWKLLNLDSESAEVLRGTHGEELMLARTKPGGVPYVLLKFKNVGGPWNERVLVAVERSSARGSDYVIAADDREAVVMIERQQQYQAFPKGVMGGIWLNRTRPGEQALKLPTRREIESEFATASAPGK